LEQESLLPLTDPRDAEAQRMLNIPYRIHMIMKPFLLLGLAAEYRSRRWPVGVINSCPTTIRGLWHSPAN